MNLFFKSYRKYLIFFTVITCESGFNIGFTQESDFYLTPWIQEIELPGNNWEIVNQSMFLDHHGNLFLGKDNGLSVFNGNRSYNVLMEGPVLVTGDHSDTLYYTASGDMGYLIMGEKASFDLLSRGYLIPASQRNFIPSGIVLYQDHLFVSSDRGVFVFTGVSCRLLEFDGKPTRLRLVKDRLYIVLDNDIALVWDGNEFVTPVDSTVRLPDPFIDYLHNGASLEIRESEGLCILDETGRVINILGNSGGLPDTEIRQVIVQDGGEIWVLGPHTLHKISYPSPLKLLEFKTPETGRILNSILIGDTLYCGTSDGLLRIYRPNEKTDLVQVDNILPETRESIHLLTASKGQLFAAGINHLYAVAPEKITLLGEGSYSGIAVLDSNRLVAGSREGIVLYEKRGTGWTSEELDPSLPFPHSFVIHGDQPFFICNNGIYRIDQNQNEPIPVSFHSEDLPQRLVPLGEELYLVCSRKVYRFEKNENIFLPLSAGPMVKTIALSDIMVPDQSGSAWMVQHEGNTGSVVNLLPALKDHPEEYTVFPVLHNLGQIINLSIHDSILYITGKNKVALLDLGSVRERKDSELIYIEEVTVTGNDASFYLAGLEFQSTPEPLFRYRLYPRKMNWTGWDAGRELFFPDLKQGKYVIEAEAIDLYGRKTAPVKFSFSVPAPIYGKWYAFVLYGILFLIGLFLFRKWRLLSLRRAESRISKRLQTKIDQMALEKEKADKLASEFLPEETLAQLKDSGRAKWDKYEMATVLFSDIQGFTRIAEEMNPESLIDELDKFFFHFDSVVEKYDIEKIKTIGDAYMAAGGIPERNITNPVEVVLAALEMQSYMAQLKASRTNIWDLRIGIHTGPVIAGVVGHKKISFDIWGDTVNTASRMESSGMPGKVNISGITYGLVKDYFLCEYRGKLPVKYKGNIDMYFVKGLRPELSVDLKEIPNKRFFINLQLLRLGDIEEKIFNGILKELPESFHFHHIEHARKVYDQSFLLGRAEEIEQEERLLVRTAALMLFTGFTQSYHNFENRSSVITRDLLIHYKYSESQIDQICNLILSTKMPFQPKNNLEKIMIDARMEFLGRPDYTKLIKLLYQELRETGIKINGQQFKNQQLELLHEFEFYTVAARRLREVSGKRQMNKLGKERWI